MDEQPPGDDQERDHSDQDGPAEGILGEISAEEDESKPPADQPAGRRRRGRSWMVGCLLALLGALAGAGVGLWLSGDGTGDRQGTTSNEAAAPIDAPIELPENRIVFSPTPDRPDETPDIISAETQVVYCFYDLGGVPAEAPLSATWSHEGESLGDLTLADHQRDEDADHATGRFELRPPATDADAETAAVFSPGIYEVELTSPDHPEVAATGSFVALPRAAQVLAGGGEPDGPPAIRSLTTATGVSDEGEPIGATSTFASDVGRITAVFTYAGIAPGSLLTVRWHVGDEEISRARVEIPITAAEGWAEAWLEIGGDESLPPGEYRVTVHLGDDDRPLASTGFIVEDASDASAPTS